MIQVSVGDRRSAARPRVDLSLVNLVTSMCPFQVCYFLEIKRSISEKKMKPCSDPLYIMCLRELTFCTCSTNIQWKREAPRKWIGSNVYLSGVKVSEAEPLFMFYLRPRRRNSSVAIATGYGLDGWVRFPGVQDFSLFHSVPTDSGAHPASCPMGTGGSFPGVKAVGPWSWSLTSIYCGRQERWKYTFTPPRKFSWHSA
jgi:hypothetical protein